ncbi:hypothetical protein SDC9_105134 [bioreactor metagenome]|uniref:Uncharacterized protein n=1 Tax=bioreactor metagenome TaxID=1076179 RepID=A0A645B583_9ZZZZ
MGPHDPLRHSCGAAGKLDAGKGASVPDRRRLLLRLRLLQSGQTLPAAPFLRADEAHGRAQLTSQPVHSLCEFCGKDQHRGITGTEQKGNLPRQQPEIQGNRHGPKLLHGVINHHQLAAVGKEVGHLVAGAHAETAQSPRDCVDAPVEPGVSIALTAEYQRGFPGIAPDIQQKWFTHVLIEHTGLPFGKLRRNGFEFLALGAER